MQETCKFSRCCRNVLRVNINCHDGIGKRTHTPVLEMNVGIDGQNARSRSRRTLSRVVQRRDFCLNKRPCWCKACQPAHTARHDVRIISKTTTLEDKTQYARSRSTGVPCNMQRTAIQIPCRAITFPRLLHCAALPCRPGNAPPARFTARPASLIARGALIMCS